MIEPSDTRTAYAANDRDLEEFIMFSVAVAGKNAKSTRKALGKFIAMLPAHDLVPPLRAVLAFKHKAGSELDDQASVQAKLARLAKQAGLGCYKGRAKSFLELADAVYVQRGAKRLDLSKATVDNLEKIHGIGRKTSRFFIVYSRPWEANNYAILDTHILSWMREQGIYAPKSTPQSSKRYRELEDIFVRMARARGVTPKELDEAIWTARRLK